MERQKRRDQLIMAGMMVGLLASEWAGWQFFYGPLIREGGFPDVLARHATDTQIAQFVVGTVLVGTPIVMGGLMAYHDVKTMQQNWRQKHPRRRS